MSEPSNLFLKLQPPASGMKRLQQTLNDQPHRTPLSRWRFVASAVAMSVLTVAWLLPGMLARHRQTDALIEAMRSSVMPLDGHLHVANGTAVELSSSRSDVRIFLVQSTSTAEPVEQASPMQ